MKIARALLILAMAVILQAPTAGAADDQLAQVKRLYFAAQYEEALALTRALPEASADATEYIVLCFLALGRTTEAEQVIERMVLKNPLAALDLEGRSLKFVSAYKPIRQRLIAIVAETMYALACASFRAGRRGVAASQFRELITLLDQIESDEQRLADLRMLAEGFRGLAEPALSVAAHHASARSHDIAVEEILTMNVVPDVAIDGSRHGPVEAKPFSPWRPQVFSAADSDVTPPVTIDQQMPPWNAPRQFTNTTFRGSVEIVIGENGVVASVRSLSRTHPMYDQILLEAAKRWSYQPALKDGRAVKYRKVVDFTLRRQ